MAWTVSALFRSFITDALGNTQAFDLSGAGVDSFKNALYNATPTPDKDGAETVTRYNTGQWVVANEVSQVGQWAAAGIAISTPALSNPAAGVTMFDAADTASGAAATLANVNGCLIYDDTLANDPGVCFLYFGGANSVTSGTFTVVYHANGIFRGTV